MRSTYIFSQETSIGQMSCHLIGSGRLLDSNRTGHCRHSLMLLSHVVVLSLFRFCSNLLDGRPEPSLTFQVIADRLVGFGQRVIHQLNGVHQ
jgi:hypothetical protein